MESVFRNRLLEKKDGTPCKIVQYSGRMLLCNIKILRRPTAYSTSEFKQQIEISKPGVKIHNLDSERSEEVRNSRFESIIYLKIDKECFEQLQD